MPAPLAAWAPFLDVTCLSEDADEARSLFQSIVHHQQPSPAALCVWPSLVSLAKACLIAAHPEGNGCRLSALVNYPGGSFSPARIIEQVERARLAGADEIDMTLPYHDVMTGRGALAQERLAVCREASEGLRLKVILETGLLAKPILIERAAALAVAGGADFLCTSGGRMPAGTTPAAVRILLSTAQQADRALGLKISGGVRDAETLAVYADLVQSIGGAPSRCPDRLRFGVFAPTDRLYALLMHAGAGMPASILDA
jgi:deoxyribose-phosphate aldolase